MNPVLALMETDSFDAFANDVANAYFQNPTHVRSLLNADCIEQCVDYVMNSQTIELDLSDLPENQPLWTKPSRQRKGRKKNTKEMKRKGSVKRFRDRSRKWQAEEHECSVYSRNLCGDGNRRGRRLAKTGEVAFKSNRRIVREVTPNEHEDTWGTFVGECEYSDGSKIRIAMSYEAWHLKDGNGSTPHTEFGLLVKRQEIEKILSKQETYWDNEDDEYFVDYTDEDDDDDEIIGADCTQEQDTAEFSAMELADIVNQIAYATPDERAKIREFFRSL